MMTSLKTRSVLAAVLAVLSAHAPTASAATAGGTTDATQWPTYGHDKGQMRFSPLAQITPDNVAQLQQAWVYRMRPPGAEMYAGPRTFGPANEPAGTLRRRFAGSEVTPLVIDNVMYLTTPYNRVVAIDATTGKEIWSAPGQGSTRGVEYWPGDAQHPAEIIFASSSSLYALDARTGKPVVGFGQNGVVEGREGTAGTSSSPPIIYRNLILSQAANPNGDGRDGDVRAFDAATGKQVWRFATVPEKGQPFYDTWPEGATSQRRGVHVWGLMSVDAERGLLYFPVNAPQWDRYGGDRPGSNLFSSSIVAVDASTGRYRWHFQIVHHDIWDFDPGAAPTLIDVKRGGRTIPAVGIISKSGLLFLLDRRDGKPIYGVEERPAPKSDVPNEQTWPTQPFPVKPAPITRQSMSMAEIATVTPELEANCRALVEKYNIGMGGPYLPPGYQRPTVNFPGTIGSANWGGMSFNPQLGLLFINSHDLGQITGISARNSPREVIGVAGAGSAGTPNVPYDMAGLLGRFKDPKTGMMCQQPPWGSLTAVNVNTGDIVWRSTLGVTDSLPADRQNTGRPNLGGTIATAGGLVFVGATDDGRFRAYDAKTGKELWTTKLSAPNHSIPISYQGRDDRQYVVLPATGGGFLEDPATDDALVAFALPPPVDTALRAPPDPAVVAAATAAAEAGGTGPYKATMVAEPSLPTHTVYRPRDMAAWGGSRKLPVIVWANGACVNVGNRFRYFLTEIASHGYFAVAIGPIGPQYLEGQSSMNPPGSPAPATPPPIARVQATKSEQLIDAMDWAVAQGKDRNSPYFGKIDTGRIAVMGQSCGGLQALVASADPRTTTSVIWNSGAFPPGAPALIGAEATKESLQKLHAPVAYFSGDTRDIAYVNTEDDYSRINQVPIFRGYQKGLGHIATYRTPNGGSYGQVAVAWLDWQLKGDPRAAAWFKGEKCRLCTDPEWVVSKKKID